jgi:hypothetical protein
MKLFEGDARNGVEPGAFPVSNVSIDDTRFDYEGNFAFCRFKSAEIYGARIGFGRGALDWRDYGGSEGPDRSFLMVDVDVMAADGAVIWQSKGRFRAANTTISTTKCELRLGNNNVFNLRGWPRSRWQFDTDDRYTSVHLTLDPLAVAILPEYVMPSNRFSMWLALCRVVGRVRLGTRTWRLKGTAHYDHPRISVEESGAAQFGWLIYAPISLSDGSYFSGYYTESKDGSAVEGQCYAWLFEPDSGRSTWFDRSEVRQLVLDNDGRPLAWRIAWIGEQESLEITSTVRPTAIARAWGNPGIGPTGADYNIPFVYDCVAVIGSGPGARRVSGTGLGECIVHSTLGAPRAT